MKGFATIVVAVASLALCGACLFYWGLSYTRAGGGWHATYWDGNLCLFYLDPDTAGPFAIQAFEHSPDHTNWGVWQTLIAYGRTGTDHRLAGFRVRDGTIDRYYFETGHAMVSPFPYDLVQLPFWALTLLTGVLPLVVFVRAKVRTRRKAKFACAECGYDLRGSPNGLCPECGTMTAVVQSTA